MVQDHWEDTGTCGRRCARTMGLLYPGTSCITMTFKLSIFTLLVRCEYEHNAKLMLPFYLYRDRVMELLREMDPVGTRQRKHRRLQRRVYRNKGPNYVWHVDGYDKLRPYGFDIHGCIDGLVCVSNVEVVAVSLFQFLYM